MQNRTAGKQSTTSPVPSGARTENLRAFTRAADPMQDADGRWDSASLPSGVASVGPWDYA